MSPQPMGHLFDNVRLNYNQSELNKRPAIAVLIAQVISQWSVIEMYNGMLFASLVGENSDATMIVFESLASAGAKDGALKALASKKLSNNDFKIFAAIISLTNNLARQRNEIAHGLVACRDELQDGVVIADTRDVAIAYYSKLVCDVDSQPPSSVYADIAKRLLHKAKIYRERDLSEIVSRIDRHQKLMAGLVVFCRPNKQTDDARKLFLSVPEIAEKVGKMT